MASLFDAEVLDASADLDEVFGLVWTVTPMIAPADPNGFAGTDPGRPSGTIIGIFCDPEEKRAVPSDSYHERDRPDPGRAASAPAIEISPSALAAWLLAEGAPLTLKRGDLMTRDDGASFRVSSTVVSPNGFVKVKVNRL